MTTTRIMHKHNVVRMVGNFHGAQIFVNFVRLLTHKNC